MQMINGFLRPINPIFMGESFGAMDSLERFGGRLCFLGAGKSAKDVVLSRHTLFQLVGGVIAFAITTLNLLDGFKVAVLRVWFAHNVKNMPWSHRILLVAGGMEVQGLMFVLVPGCER